MNRYPAKLGKRVPRSAEEESEAMPFETSVNPYLSFRYSYTEISTLGGRARVKSRKVRYESGKLAEETLEGEVDRTVYDQIVDHAQRYFLAQADILFGAFAALLPPSRNRSGRR